MLTTYEKRNKSRLYLGYIGSVIVTIGAILFTIGIVAAFLDVDDSIISITNMVAYALCAISFGIFFTLIFGRIGWHDNKVIDLLLNQISVMLAMSGVIIAILANLFGLSGRVLIIGVGISILGFFMGLLGIHFHKIPR
jgi:O-antigen/teichoic acid export membrane protein